MMPNDIEAAARSIQYIENRLSENLNLESVAEAAHYSKFHLHRIFTNAVGMTVHTYIQRRRLTNAAKALVFSDAPILEIALSAGYRSQQAFTNIFKEMYKKTPLAYRIEADYYPLQLECILNVKPTIRHEAMDWKADVAYAVEQDIPVWMKLVRLVVDGFPCLKEAAYLNHLQRCIHKRRALIIKDQEIAVGILIFRLESGHIDFFGIHPQYRKSQIAKALLEKAIYEFSPETAVSITTFRRGDKADPGYRAYFQKLGFVEKEHLVEFGYPTQKFVLPFQKRKGNSLCVL